MKAQFGRKYRDSITGFEGVATGRSEYMNGCARVLLEGNVNGKPEEQWFDEQRLVAGSPARAGGPAPAPPSRDPR